MTSITVVYKPRGVPGLPTRDNQRVCPYCIADAACLSATHGVTAERVAAILAHSAIDLEPVRPSGTEFTLVDCGAHQSAGFTLSAVLPTLSARLSARGVVTTSPVRR